MTNLLSCCCDCTSTRRVFRPCLTTSSDTDIRAPVLTDTQFDDCGFEEGKVYHYQPAAGECDDYCGTWVCLNIADDASNRCHPTVGSGCPSCADWDGLFFPPFREVLSSEMPSFCSKFTEIESCCDDTVCPTTCDFGDIQTGDCSTCYDPALLGWSLAVGGGQLTQQSSSVGWTITLDLVTAANVTASIVGTSVVIDFDVVFSFSTTPTPTNWDCSGTSPDPVGCIECADPGTDTFPDSFDYVRSYTVTVPCMTAPSIGTATQSIDPSTYCGGYNSYGTGQQPIANLSTNSFAHAIGWGGNAECFVLDGNFDITLGNHPHLALPGGATETVGSGLFRVALNLSLPERPDPCV